jgi:hypothetical protein
VHLNVCVWLLSSSVIPWVMNHLMLLRSHICLRGFYYVLPATIVVGHWKPSTRVKRASATTNPFSLQCWVINVESYLDLHANPGLQVRTYTNISILFKRTIRKNAFHLFGWKNAYHSRNNFFINQWPILIKKICIWILGAWNKFFMSERILTIWYLTSNICRPQFNIAWLPIF